MLLRLVDQFLERKPLNHKTVENVTYFLRGPCINMVQNAYHGPTRIGLFANYWEKSLVAERGDAGTCLVGESSVFISVTAR